MLPPGHRLEAPDIGTDPDRAQVGAEIAPARRLELGQPGATSRALRGEQEHPGERHKPYERT